MSGNALRGAFNAVRAFNQSIHNWYDEKSFKLYYAMMCADPSAVTAYLPVSDTISGQINNGLNAARYSFLNSSTTQAAAGDHAKPSYGNVWAGFMVQMQNGLRPALETTMRTGLGGPLRLAVLGLAAVIMVDALSGGHLRDTAAQVMNSLSGDITHTQGNKNGDDIKTVPADDWKRTPQERGAALTLLYGRPSVF